MQPYQAADGRWIIFDGMNKIYFDTQLEAEKAMAKLDTAKAIVSAVKTLTTVNDLSGDLVSEYFDAGTFVDADVAALGITAAQLASCITLLEQAGKFMNSEATTPIMHRVTLNAVRRVSV